MARRGDPRDRRHAPRARDGARSRKPARVPARPRLPALGAGGDPNADVYAYGTDDPVADVDIVESVVAALPRAEMHLVEGAGHVTWLEDPAAVGERVRRFLAQP